MVKAELSYNPYLLETGVTFNGCKPKINSLVEKHLRGPLQKWVGRIPDIFCGEMNGYGFELEFTGTTADFEALQAAFQATFDTKKISRKSVRLFHKNELEDARKKSERLSGLLDWLCGNPNRRFDYPAFRSACTELFDTGYSFIVVQGERHKCAFPDVVVEYISSTDELEQTDLENTPVLFCVNEQNRAALEGNLRTVIKHKKVVPEQLFFLIGQFPDRFRVERLIADSGIKEPQFVSSPDDDRIRQFLMLYPVTDYIRRAIEAFRQEEKTLRDILQAEDRRSVQANGDLHQKIEALDTCVHLIKSAHERILQRDNYRRPDALDDAKNDCLARIQHWRKKKVKITDAAEAVCEAETFEGEVQSAFAAFIERAQAIFRAEAGSIHAGLDESYASAEYDDAFSASECGEIDLTAFSVPELSSSLLCMFTEQYTDTKNPADFLGGLLKNLPAAANTKQKEPVRSVTYLYSEWRQRAAETLAPVLDEVITRAIEALSDFDTQTAAGYLRHLESREQQQANARRKTAAQLTSDEQELHADHEWFSTFQEKLRKIEGA